MASTAWTPDTEALLTRLWTEEGCTFAEIARAVTEAGYPVTRSAVSGRISRLGLVGKQRPKPAKAPSATKPENGGDLSTAGGGESGAGIPVTEQFQGVSPAACEVAQNRKLTRNACPAEAVSGFAPSSEVEKTDMPDDVPPPSAGEGEATGDLTIVAAKINTPAAGAWPIAALREGQCRFACTGHKVPADQHRFCGARTHVGPGNLHGSWCPEHLAVMFDRSSRMARPEFLKGVRRSVG